MTFRSRHNFSTIESGFTLIELVLTISLIGILSAVGISMFTGSVDEGRYDSTVLEMRQISHSLAGDPNDKKGGTRASFGYLGDLGALPSTTNTLGALVTKPSAAANWNVNNTARIGLGWNGPYLSSGVNGQDPLKDAWGRDYIYTTGTNASITSYGADGTSGGSGYNQDIVMPIPGNLQTATVYGFLSNGGSPFTTAAQAEIYYPNGNGVLASTMANIANGSQGQFQFNNIPLGNRSIAIYVPSKTSPTQTIGPIPITVDSGNYLVSTNLTDLNPGGGGNGGGGGGGSGTCSTPVNAAAVSAALKYSIGSQINFGISVNPSVTVTQIKVTIPSAVSISEVRFSGTRYRCTGSRQLSPCPLANATTATLSRTHNLNSGNRTIQLNFSSSVNSESSVIVELIYSTGCDILNVTGLL